MKTPLKLLFILAGFSLLGAPASASENMSLQSDVQLEKSYLGLSLENSSFTLKEGVIKGSSVKIDFAHNFSGSLSVDLYLATAFVAGQKSQATFTGLGGYVYYTVLGNCCILTKTTSVGGSPLIVEKSQPKNVLQVGVGADQYFLNGSRAVYSASGLGVGGNYLFNVYKYRVKAGVRYSSMTASQQQVGGLFYSLGIVFPL